MWKVILEKFNKIVYVAKFNSIFYYIVPHLIELNYIFFYKNTKFDICVAEFENRLSIDRNILIIGIVVT